jgi:MtfA peptidase
VSSFWSRLFRWRRAKPLLDDVLWQHSVAASPLARRLDPAALEHLRQRVTRFLQRKNFVGAAGFEPDALQRCIIAVQACMPLIAHPPDAMDGWYDVIVYPGAFRVRQRHHDAPTGVVSERDEVRIGEAWEGGPLVLSWNDLAEDLHDPWSGFNVVVHEMAHKLDMLDGGTDGVPRLIDRNFRRRWIDTFQAAFDRLQRRLHHGQRVAIDPYAAENPGEYFAVVSEMHFSAPERLEHAEPEVATLLRDYYGPSPAPRSPTPG